MTGTERNQPGATGPAISWRRHTDDTIRSVDSTYWISRAPVPNRGMVYTAAFRPQDLKRDGVHLGCHDSGTAAKEACARHAEGSARAVA